MRTGPRCASERPTLETHRTDLPRGVLTPLSRPGSRTDPELRTLLLAVVRCGLHCPVVSLLPESHHKRQQASSHARGGTATSGLNAPTTWPGTLAVDRADRGQPAVIAPTGGAIAHHRPAAGSTSRLTGRPDRAALGGLSWIGSCTVG